MARIRSVLILPELTATDIEGLKKELNEWGRLLSDYSRELSDMIGSGEVYNISNRTETRSLDCDSTSIEELADVLATLIKDLNLE